MKDFRERVAVARAVPKKAMTAVRDLMDSLGIPQSP